MTADYELELKIKNAPFLNIMRERGYKTVAQLARDVGVTQNVVHVILKLQTPLYTMSKLGHPHIRPSVEKIADFFGCSPEALYPESHWFEELEQNKFSAQISRSQLEQLTHNSTGDPQNFLEYIEASQAFEIEALLEKHASLPPRTQQVLLERFRDGKKLEDIGKSLGVSSARARQILEKGLRQIRCGKNIGVFESAAEYHFGVDT